MAAHAVNTLHNELHNHQPSGHGDNGSIDNIPTLKSVVLTGDETVIHSARVRHNLDNLTSALAAESLSWQDETATAESIREDSLKLLIDRVIDSHVAGMRAEILAILETHGAKPDRLLD